MASAVLATPGGATSALPTTIKEIRPALLDGAVVEVDESLMLYALGVLPPIYGTRINAFAISERVGFSRAGAITYYWFSRLSTDETRWWCYLGSEAEAETAFFKEGIRLAAHAAAVEICGLWWTQPVARQKTLVVESIIEKYLGGVK